MASRITVAMVAGEASGDQLAAHLIKALRERRARKREAQA